MIRYTDTIEMDSKYVDTKEELNGLTCDNSYALFYYFYKMKYSSNKI